VSFSANASYDPDGAVSDFEWDLDGDGNFNETGPEADARSSPTVNYTYSDSGDYTAVVRVTDNDGATDTATAQVSVGEAGEWHFLQIPATWHVAQHANTSSLAVIDGCPAIAYAVHATPNAYLFYTKADTAAGLSASDWSEPVQIDDDASSSAGYCSLAEVEGNPAICYYLQGSRGLQYVRSTTSTGTNAADWSQTAEIFEFSLSSAPAMSIVADHPAIAWGIGWDAMYRRATTPTGESQEQWGEAVIAYEST